MSSSATHVAESVNQSDFREVIGHFMTGVTVITTAHEGQRYGVTASAFSSLSLDPPMLLVCLNRNLATADAVRASGTFAVNILCEDQGALATQFATRHPDKFRGVSVVPGMLDVPVLGEALAHIECEVHETVTAATHTVFLGRVRHASSRVGRPLAYFRGTFGQFVEALLAATPDQASHR
jgi:flavin reductase (DIM6/NTAB) family NADH-FMN oxidoreductase RutF